MLNVIVILAIMMAVIGVMVLLQVKGVKIMGSKRRYFEAFEMAQSSIDYGILMIKKSESGGEVIVDTSFTLEGYTGEVRVNLMFTAVIEGANIAFGAGYEELGKGAASGGAANHFHLISDATGLAGENVVLEVGYRRIIGVQAK